MKNAILKYTMILSFCFIGCSTDELVVDELVSTDTVVPEETFIANQGKIDFRSNEFILDNAANGYSYYCPEIDTNGDPTGLWFHHVGTMEYAQIQNNVGLNGWTFEKEGDFVFTLVIRDDNYDDLVGYVRALYMVNINNDNELAVGIVDFEIDERTETFMSGTFTGSFRTIVDNIDVGIISGEFAVPILECK